LEDIAVIVNIKLGYSDEAFGYNLTPLANTESSIAPFSIFIINEEFSPGCARKWLPGKNEELKCFTDPLSEAMNTTKSAVGSVGGNGHGGNGQGGRISENNKEETFSLLIGDTSRPLIKSETIFLYSRAIPRPSGELHKNLWLCASASNAIAVIVDIQS
jgi:hypothetical protein